MRSLCFPCEITLARSGLTQLTEGIVFMRSKKTKKNPTVFASHRDRLVRKILDEYRAMTPQQRRTFCLELLRDSAPAPPDLSRPYENSI